MSISENLTSRIAEGLTQRLGRKYTVSLRDYPADIAIVHKKSGHVTLVDVEDIGQEYDVPLAKIADAQRLLELPAGRSQPSLILVSTGNVPQRVRDALDSRSVHVLQVGAAEDFLPDLTQTIKDTTLSAGVDRRSAASNRVRSGILKRISPKSVSGARYSQRKNKK